MGKYFDFFHAANNPVGLSGLVGGGISSDQLKQEVGGLFARRDTSETGPLIQYRKLYVKQTETATFDNLEIHLENVEHTGHIAMASELTSNDRSLHPTSIPSGYVDAMFSGNSGTPLPLGSSSNGDSFGFWIKQTLPENVGTDELASFIIQVRGDKS